MSDIIFIRIYHSLEEEFGYLSKFGNIEISNGLCWLAAVTRQHSYDTEIIDAFALKIDNDRLCHIIADKNPKYLGISACTMDIDAASDLAQRIKKIKPSIIIIVGGPHITAVPEETMRRFFSFDMGVLGEGETTIIELLDSLEAKSRKRLNEIEGLIIRDNDKIIKTGNRAFISDLDSLPLPAWDLLPDLKKYYFAPVWTVDSGRSATIITSRGCPYQCIYCDRKVFGNSIRFHSADYVIKMMKTLHYQYGIRHLRIGDDNFIFDKERLYEICDYLIKERLRMTWCCLARVDSINPNMLVKMREAGCYSIAFGVETGSEEIHAIEKKQVTLEKIEKAVSLTRRSKINTIGLNMIGHPLETVETIKKTIAFNKRIKIDDFKTAFLVPFPGTEFYQNADQFGTFDRDWKKMREFREPIFIPHGLTKEELIKWNKKGFMSFYLQPRIIFSYLSRIRSLNELKVLLIGAFTITSWKIRELFRW